MVQPRVTLSKLPASVTARADGSARYAMGFDPPPGRRGMKPTLSLEYDSDRPDGLVGRGMHRAGLSHIAPCARTLILDGVSEAPRYDGGDPLWLDGMIQRYGVRAFHQYIYGVDP